MDLRSIAINATPPREIAAFVVSSLLAQGRMSTAPSNEDTKAVTTAGVVCFYRGDSGAKCAAGFLIKDEDYSRHMEGRGVARVLGNPVYAGLPKLSDEAMQTITILQNLHDTHTQGVAVTRESLVATYDKYVSRLSARISDTQHTSEAFAAIREALGISLTPSV